MNKEEKVLQEEVVEQEEVKVETPIEPTKDDIVEEQEELIDEQEEKKPNRNEVLRELSKELGVNLFEVEGLQALKDLKASQDKRIEEIKQEVESIKQREEQARVDAENARLETLRIKYNLDAEKFEDFLTLTKAQVNDETSVEQAFTKTLERYGDTFISKRPREEIQLGLQVDSTNPVKKTVETFDEQVLNAYLKRRK